MKKHYMIKRITLVLVLIAFSIISYTNAQTLKPCGTTEYQEEIFKLNPGLREKVEAFEQQQAHSAHKINGPDTTVWIIPIVFHIIHSYTADDITDAQVIDEVRILNLDYRHLNLDSGSVVPSFKAIAGDARIEFRLAQIDPQGNPTNGIDRVYSPKTNGGSDASKLNDWDPHKYLNVWTTSTIGQSGVAGYSNYPSVAQYQPTTDGVLILSNYIGSIGTGSPNTSRALTHEIGHYLNLAHTWGSTNQPGVACGGTDNVSDTPETIGWKSCNLSGSVCHPPVIENVQNYMEYAYCSNMFTKGQIDRMRIALRAPTAGRSNLSDTNNLKATGVLNNPPLLAKPVADFNPATLYVCKGGTVNLKDLSWKGAPTSWKWVLPGSEFGSYTSQNPTVKYVTPGVFDVKLIVQNATGTDSVTKSTLVCVMDDTKPDTLPYKQGFEEAGEINTTPGWFSTNQYNDNVKWTKTTQYFYSGKQGLILGNVSTKDSLMKDALISPSMDFSKATDPRISFKYAYQRKKNTSADYLKIYYSTNCGVNWYSTAVINASKLATVKTISIKSFLPTSLQQWNDTSLKVAAIAGKPSVMFKFEYNYALSGNNLFLDDINFYPDQASLISGEAEIKKQVINWVTVSPNPTVAAEDIKVAFNLTENKDVTLNLYDLTGRAIQQIVRKNQPEGTNEIMLNTSSLKSGIYLLSFVTDKTSKQFKIIVE